MHSFYQKKKDKPVADAIIEEENKDLKDQQMDEKTKKELNDRIATTDPTRTSLNGSPTNIDA